MINGKEDLLQALIEAFLMEKGTEEFYSYASEKSKNSEAKKIFRELAEWEKKHMDYIQYLYQSINGEQELKSFEDFRNRTGAPLTEAGIPVKDLKEKIEKHEFTDEMGALTLAMEIEGKSYNLYHKLSQDAKDTNAKVVFSEMMEQEVKHVEYLKNLRLKLVKVYQ
jgi:rubrerythrin